MRDLVILEPVLLPKIILEPVLLAIVILDPVLLDIVILKPVLLAMNRQRLAFIFLPPLQSSSFTIQIQTQYRLLKSLFEDF